MTKNFKFAIMGAGKIAAKFCEAVNLLEDAEIIAIASKSEERAKDFAVNHNIAMSYGNYKELLEKEHPDCVYIAATTNVHYDLTMLCLDYKVPVLCEKAMFINSKQAREVFDRSKQLGVFVMEAMWSRFLPTVLKVKEWIKDRKIGIIELGNLSIGFCAPKDYGNRFYKKELGGGASYDITVYAYEIMTYFIEEELRKTQVQVSWSESGVDVTNQILLEFEHARAFLQASFAANLEEKAILYGDKGRIEILRPHAGGEAFFYDNSNVIQEHYKDNKTTNGFVYEIQEVIECIRNNQIESSIVPHSLTIRCAMLFDQIMDAK